MTAVEYCRKFQAMDPRELIAFFRSDDSVSIESGGYVALAVVAIRYLEEALDRSDFQTPGLDFDPDTTSPIVAEAASGISAYWDGDAGLFRGMKLHKPPTDDGIAEEDEVRPWPA